MRTVDHSQDPLRACRWVRQVGNGVNLSTALGVAIALIGRARLRRGPDGLVLADGYRLGFPRAGAFTVGDVVITAYPDWNVLFRDRPELLRHEARHAWQWLCCGGWPFLVAYGVTMVWSWWRTGDRATANWFERQAGLADGGYLSSPFSASAVPRVASPARRPPAHRTGSAP